MDNHTINTDYFDMHQPNDIDDKHSFRNYTNDSTQSKIKQTYQFARSHQSVEHVLQMHRSIYLFHIGCAFKMYLKNYQHL